MAGRVVEIVVHADDDIERRRLIDAEVRRVRWMLKRELPRALRRMRAAGGKVEGRGE